MDFKHFLEMKSLVMDEEFFLSYSGFVSEDILEAVGQTLRDRLVDMKKNPQQIRQVFSIFVELMQNVIRYGDDGPQSLVNPESKPSYGMLTVSKNGDNLVVMSGNYISNEDAEKMCDRIDQLRNCSADELRKIYKDKLRQPTEETSKGASLGLIEIARRSATPPEYHLSEGPDGTSFFIIKASA